MPNNKGSVNIGLSIAYQKTLEEMTSAFKSRLTALSNEFKKVGFSKDVGEQFDAVYKKIDNVSTEMRAMFDTINKNKLDASQFEQYQLKVTKEFGKIETSISNLNKKLDILGGADFSSDIIKQVNDLKNAYKGLDQVLGLIEPSSGKTAGNIDSSAIESYKKTLEQIKKVQKEVENTTFDGKNNDEIHAMLKEEEQALKSSLASYKKLQTEIQAMSSTDPGYHQKKNELVGYYLAIYQTADALEKLEQAENDNGGNFTFDKSIRRTLDALMDADTKVDNYAAQIRKIIQTNKNASDSLEQTQGTFDTFQIKNGAIHVPIEIDKADANLKRQLQETIGKLQTEADNNSIIAKVKLTLDGASSKGYKKNAEMDKQQQEGQNEPALDFAGAINKKYREAAREAETLVKQQIRQIQSELKEVKIRIKPDDKAFVDDLSKMVNTSLKEIAKKTSGLNVNKELEQLISNLKEVSTSLVGNENFKLGLDEASINRITAAIENMANMIQRAFGVASDGDIAAQWTAIESKFKGVAGEEGKLLKSNKEHKFAIQELAIEYKKYIDMGGKNDLSELTTHKQTIKNIANEYERLTAEVKETQDVLEQKGTEVVLTPIDKSFKADAENILDAINLEKAVKLTVKGKSIGDIQDGLDKALTKAEIVQNAVNQIPQAEGTGRFIHWTSPESALQKLTNPKGISLEGAGTLSQFTDALGEAESSSKIILECFESLHHVFGDNVLVIDIPIEEIKAFNDITKTPDFIPRDYIKGMVNAVDGTVKLNNDQTTASNGVKEAVANNKALAKQAGQTAKKLEEEGNVVQTAAERFAELAEKKKAATDANLELGIAAEMTTNALKEEIAALKEAEKSKRTNKNAVDEGTYETNVSTWQNSIKQHLLDNGSYLEVYDGKLSRLESGTVRYTAFVRDSAEKGKESWKKLTATISNTGEIQSTKLQDITEKQFLKMEKEKKDAAKMLEKMSEEEAEPISLNASEMKAYSEQVRKIIKDLGDLTNTNYRVDVTSDGKLLIAKKEISDTGAEAEAFTITIDKIDDVLEKTADGVVVSSEKIQNALTGAFDSAKISTSTKDLTSKAQDVFDKFTLKHQKNSNWSQVADDVERVRQTIANIDSQNGLNEFKQNLTDIATKLNNIDKNNKLGKVLDINRTFNDINEVRANIDSLFASMGKVNEKSIRVDGTKKLTAEIKQANGEIRQMTVNLDSDGFARYVDNGIVQFGRLRRVAEGVFKGIKNLVRIYLSPQDFVRYFRQGFDAVKDIDTAMTELRKVSDASNSDLASYFDEATESAKQLGSSVSDMIGATADWSRMGMKQCPII